MTTTIVPVMSIYRTDGTVENVPGSHVFGQDPLPSLAQHADIVRYAIGDVLHTALRKAESEEQTTGKISQETYNELKTHIETLLTKINNQQSDLNTCRTRLREVWQQQLPEHAQVLENMTREINELRATVAQKDEQIADHERMRELDVAELEDRLNHLIALEKQVSEQSATVQSTATEVNNLRISLAEKEEQVAQLTRQHTNDLEELDDLKNRVIQLEQHIIELDREQRYSRDEEEQEQQQQFEVDDLKKRIKYLEDEIVDLNKELAEQKNLNDEQERTEEQQEERPGTSSSFVNFEQGETRPSTSFNDDNFAFDSDYVWGLANEEAQQQEIQVDQETPTERPEEQQVELQMDDEARGMRTPTQEPEEQQTRPEMVQIPQPQLQEQATVQADNNLPPAKFSDAIEQLKLEGYVYKSGGLREEDAFYNWIKGNKIWNEKIKFILGAYVTHLSIDNYALLSLTRWRKDPVNRQFLFRKFSAEKTKDIANFTIAELGTAMYDHKTMLMIDTQEFRTWSEKVSGWNRVGVIPDGPGKALFTLGENMEVPKYKIVRYLTFLFDLIKRGDNVRFYPLTEPFTQIDSE